MMVKGEPPLAARLRLPLDEVIPPLTVIGDNAVILILPAALMLVVCELATDGPRITPPLFSMLIRPPALRLLIQGTWVRSPIPPIPSILPPVPAAEMRSSPAVMCGLVPEAPAPEP